MYIYIGAQIYQRADFQVLQPCRGIPFSLPPAPFPKYTPPQPPTHLTTHPPTTFSPPLSAPALRLPRKNARMLYLDGLARV